MMRRIITNILAMASFFSFSLQSAIADTEVCGNITSDTTWRLQEVPTLWWGRCRWWSVLP